MAVKLCILVNPSFIWF